MTAEHKRSRSKRRMIDRDFPHQVALPDDLCCLENFKVIEPFCLRFGYSPPTRHVKAIWPDGKYEHYRLYCFADRAEAELFAEHFEGHHFDPVRDRDRGLKEGPWKRTGAWSRILTSGPLKMPRSLRSLDDDDIEPWMRVDPL